MSIQTKLLNEFREKANESFAKGGFLTTDYPGEDGVNKCELDPIAIYKWIEQALQQHGESERKEADELVKAIHLYNTDAIKALESEYKRGYEDGEKSRDQEVWEAGSKMH